MRAIPACLLLALLLPVTIPAHGAPDQAAMELNVTLEPNAVDVFPTNSWNLPIKFVGVVLFTKARPDDVFVDLEVTADVDWMLTYQPQTMVFSQVGEGLGTFQVTLMVPPMMAGPITVHVEAVAVVRLYGRDVRDSDASVVTFVSNADEFMANVPDKIAVVGDGGVDGQMRVYNLMDEQMEFHLCALGEWGERIPDLDFQLPVVLESLQMRQVRFHGSLSDEVGSGEYKVELALWTVMDGEQMYVTSRNVTLVVAREGETLLRTVLRLGLFFLLVGVVALAAVLYYVLRARRTADGRAPGGLHRLRGAMPRVPARRPDTGHDQGGKGPPGQRGGTLSSPREGG